MVEIKTVAELDIGYERVKRLKGINTDLLQTCCDLMKVHNGVSQLRARQFGEANLVEPDALFLQTWSASRVIAKQNMDTHPAAR